MQLRRLAALERQKIIDQLAEIELEIADLKDILDKPERQRAIVREELLAIVEKHGGSVAVDSKGVVWCYPERSEGAKPGLMSPSLPSGRRES